MTVSPLRHSIILIAVLLALTACGTNAPAATNQPATQLATDSPPEPTPVPLRTVTIGTSESINSLDYADANTSAEWELLSNVNLGLLTFEAGTTNIAPGVASSYEVSDDGLHYTFILEEGWKFPDGQELNAFDFVRGITRSLRLTGSGGPLIRPYVESVFALDDYTLEITLNNPRGDFPQIVTTAPYMPLAAGQVSDDELEKLPAVVIGVGPWQIVEHIFEEKIVLERNPNFKMGFSPSSPERINVLYYSDAKALVDALASKEIDIAWRSLDLSAVDQLSEMEAISTTDSGFGGTRTLLINHSNEFLRSKLIRQALSHLIDRDELVREVFSGKSLPLFSIVPPSFPAANQTYLDLYGRGADIEAANALLAEAGYFNFEPIELKLRYPADQYGLHTQEIATLLELQLEASPAVNITLEPLDWITFLSSLISGDYQLLYLGWAFDRYPDTSNYVETFALSEISTRIGIEYINQDIDTLLMEASSTSDQEARAALYLEAQKLYAEEIVAIPLLFESEYSAWSNNLIREVLIGPIGYLHYSTIQMVE
jgi:peptide/nickel transport system substrate-binding protein